MDPQRTTRPVVEHIVPLVDCGRFPVKHVLGDVCRIEADIFVDGHDNLDACMLHKGPCDESWSESPMRLLGNDHWDGEFRPGSLGMYQYALAAWVDEFATWRRGVGAKHDAGQDVSVDLLAGAALVRAAAGRVRDGGASSVPKADPASPRLDDGGATAGLSRPRLDDGGASRGRGDGGTTRRAWGDGSAALVYNDSCSDDAAVLEDWAQQLESGGEEAVSAALDPDLAAMMTRHTDRTLATFSPAYSLLVDSPRAAAGAWYELFPRSWAQEVGQHGTLDDVRRALPYIAGMGFDVLYLTPIHPIGKTFRKGANNVCLGDEGSPGSPWAIGSAAGGHTAIEPALGTFADFDRLVEAAAGYDLEIALDVAFQCSPDHPWVHEHPEWFRHRPDGSIAYAENPPKKYEDIYPVDFATHDWKALWNELAGVVRFWIGHGVSIFRVDNPHTKPFDFWEWLIAGIRRDHPDVVFLAEAFTRPRPMYRLAKLGFDQSYAYFPWRTTKQELTEYMTELTTTGLADFFRPSFWTNTPDILIEYLQRGGRPAFAVRLILAATLSANYGVYGPAYELLEAMPREPGSEEYADSEKYEIRWWDLDRPDSLAPLISTVNQIRHGHPALLSNRGLHFHGIDNEQLIAYSKVTADGSDAVLVIVNLDPRWTQSGWTDLDLGALGIPADETFALVDELDGTRYRWSGRRNFVRLDPDVAGAHIFSIQPSPAGDRVGSHERPWPEVSE